MMAIIGMFYQDGLTGQAWGDWELYTDSPLRAFENEFGVQPPVGFWDPLGFTADGDVAAFKRRRTVEIKHGRVSMLACMGYIVPEYFRFDGYLSPSTGLKFADLPNGLQAASKVSPVGWLQWVLFCGMWEFLWDGENAQGWWGLGETKGNPGEYGWKVLSAKDEAGRTRKLNAEIANGRLAMIAIIGMFYQDGLTGSAWGDWSAFTDSPLRAFESELGVQPPVGFWDPLGFTADGDVAAFKRRRTVEIKHGRVSMLACMGYIVPEYFRFDGYLSPSTGLKFADLPNGLQATSKVSPVGWLQWVLFCGMWEFLWDGENAQGWWGFGETKGNPGEYGWKALSAKDEAGRTRKLNAEIANGRLAMMAIIGMFYQDGLTGSAWGDWSLYTDSPLRAFENELG